MTTTYRAISVLVVASLVVGASGCFCFVVPADPSKPMYVRGFDDWFEPHGAGIILQSVAQPVTQTLSVLMYLMTFKWLWDHSRFPFSGLIDMLIRIVSIIPGIGYSGPVFPFEEPPPDELP
jgi:hypothetical protein